jgi:aconitate hydratase
MSLNPFNAKKKLTTAKGEFNYWSLQALQQQGYAINKLPFSIRILLENALQEFR